MPGNCTEVEVARIAAIATGLAPEFAIPQMTRENGHKHSGKSLANSSHSEPQVCPSPILKQDVYFKVFFSHRPAFFPGLPIQKLSSMQKKSGWTPDRLSLYISFSTSCLGIFFFRILSSVPVFESGSKPLREEYVKVSELKQIDGAIASGAFLLQETALAT